MAIELFDFALDLAQRTDVGGSKKAFVFRLARKPVSLHGKPFVQHWMPKPGLYADRGRRSPNRQTVLDCYLEICRRSEEVTTDADAIQSYVLANMTADRGNGARRILLDASLRDGIFDDGLNPDSWFPQLEEMVRQSRHERLDPGAFHEKTRSILGPSEYDQQILDLYDRLERRLFPWRDADHPPDAETALDIARAVWKAELRTIGRRCGNEAQKQVLDMFARECRGAFNRAYSLVWWFITDALRLSEGFDDFGFGFHRLWHLDLPIDGVWDRRIHLFHGNPFALHPASGYFLATPTGAELTRRWVERPQDLTAQGEFLHALYIAVFDYARRHAEANEERRLEAS